jgi:uncharacterized protein DUF2474
MAAPEAEDVRPRWLQRLGWLALLWLGGIAATGLVAGALRLLMAWAGMQR